jgi:hypothetical protein
MDAPVPGIKKIVGTDIAKGRENIFPRSGNSTFYCSQNIPYLPAGGFFKQRTDGADFPQGQPATKLLYFLLIKIGKGTDEGKPTGKQLLLRHHGAEITGIEHVEKKSLDNIITVMAHGQLIVVILVCVGKKLSTTAAGTPETNIIYSTGCKSILIKTPGSREDMTGNREFLENGGDFAGCSAGPVCLRLHINMDAVNCIRQGRFFLPEL